MVAIKDEAATVWPLAPPACVARLYIGKRIIRSDPTRWNRFIFSGQQICHVYGVACIRVPMHSCYVTSATSLVDARPSSGGYRHKRPDLNRRVKRHRAAIAHRRCF
jgi:hypothetical protein